MNSIMKQIVYYLLFTILFSTIIFITNAQVTPQEANKAMARGINIGNTMEPEKEGGWNNGVVQEYYFDDYKAAGFTSIRIPIRWDKHTANTSPYKIDDAWMKRVEQVVDWGLQRDLYIVINAHHEDWIKTGYGNKNLRDRFDSIWSQIAVRFQNKSEKLLFEIINEPNGLTVANINELNARELSIIRKTNPTRIVLFSGNLYANSDQLITAAIPNDPYLMGYFHSYDPWSFAGEATGTWGTSSDKESIRSKFAKVAQWSTLHNVPVTINEFGAQQKCDYNSRMYHYSVYTEMALNYGISFNVWDDGGDFKIYDRAKRSWNEIKDIVIYTSDSSTTQLKLSQVEDKINLTWQLRSKTIDSIKIERKNNSGIFQTISTLPGNATSFSDDNTETYKTYYYRVVAKYANGITIPSYPVSGFKIATERSPFLGTPVSIPGTIEAENFDEGGELLTFHDADFVNTPGKYRTNVGVDIMSREDGGFQVTNITAGEWLEYTINIAEAGDYVIDTWVSSVEGGGKFSYLIGKIGVASITVPKTQDIQTLVKTTITRSLNAGEQIMRLKLNSIPTFAIDRIEISKPNTSVNELKSNNSCSVYSPIPGIVTVELKDEATAEISIYNTMGNREFRGLLKQGMNMIELPSAGACFYQVITKTGTVQTGKMIVK
jgi:aryl-phospho-beta-D-glucosidase BglC (GH1 family)